MTPFLIKYRNVILLATLLLSLLMHAHTFTKELMSIHVWRQTQTQSNIVNFYEEDFNILHPKRNYREDGDGLFQMEFPLMQWLIACFYKLFGNHLIITRICTFVIGIFSVLGMYRLVNNLFGNQLMGLFGAFAFTFSPCFFYYMVNPLPDNFALCLCIWGLAHFFAWWRNPINKNLILCGLFLALGTSCKLPFVVYYSVPFGYFMLQMLRKESFKRILLDGILVGFPLILPTIWYISVIPSWHNNGIVQGMAENGDSSNKILEYLWHNLISALPELLLNYAAVPFFVLGFYFLVKNKAFKHQLFPVLVLWSMSVMAYFLFEINMISKDHDYYLFPFYPLLFILVAYGAGQLYQQKVPFIKYAIYIVFLALPVTCFLRMQHRWDENKPGFNKDLLVHKNELRNAVPKDALCIIGNDKTGYVSFYYLDKKGWAFHDDQLDAPKLSEMIQKGAQYLYSDSRSLDENPAIIPFLQEKITEKGSIRVYSLQIPH